MTSGVSRSRSLPFSAMAGAATTSAIKTMQALPSHSMSLGDVSTKRSGIGFSIRGATKVGRPIHVIIAARARRDDCRRFRGARQRQLSRFEPKTLRTSASLRRRRQTPRLSGAVYPTAHTAIWKEKLDCRSFHACALAGTALGSKWRPVKRCGLVAELTDHLAHDQLIVIARLGDADLP